MQADVVILGGGSSGCVMAARLSEDPSRRVVLVEAGRDISEAEMPDEIRSRYPGRAYLDPRNIWAGLSASYGPSAARRYEQAQILGGGSAINALMSNRGAPSDYAEWVEAGATGWGWDDVLAVFRRIEADRDEDGPYHGKSGPLVLRRASDRALSPFVRHVMETLDARGHPVRPDQNGEWQDGTFRGVTAISDKGERQPASVVWLTPEVRRRPNLAILTRHRALRLIFQGRRVAGAEILGPEGVVTIAAPRVVLCAGAIHSPAILLRSGIGPGGELQSLGINVLADRGGVGRNLMEHPSIAVSTFLPPSMRVQDRGEHHEQAVWRYSSGLAEAPAGDMHGAILSRSGWHSVGLRMGSIFFWVNKSYSRGWVRLVSSDPGTAPAVNFRMLSDERDLVRLCDALRRGAEVLTDPMLRGRCGPVFPASYTPRVARIARPGLWNALQRGTLSGLLDVAGPLRSALVHSAITMGRTLSGLLADPAALEEFVRANVGGTWHPSGSCRMGRADDAMAVTDSDGGVIGVDGLTVADASIMPTIPCANTNLPTLMIAERIADRLIA
ncbi:GMC family oxidoreductase N-terminal domain-containing protein [Paracoccus sp. MBLB3053]|uniref:GMC family oxidoreductase N-terminal domain-containing protein n=1 Tax=Paracoccus aurantius TaxID=3073814 RepID=A0ABU2HY07_9RHOB|nr:GMC family oxidoreductase N-terminal domain-containing protein [Paracoccus sp. MBLB3053]MDS9469942.1 GMC family oxidoreductase N-terminal domain-containing protein [Paracoccus sp. MBLB3053]